MRRWFHYQFLRVKRIVWRLVRSNSSEHSIALGLGLGYVSAMQPLLLGCQMAFAMLLATLFRANRLASIFPPWITNPVTIIPIYSFNYWLGHKISGLGPNVKDYLNVLHQLRNLEDNPDAAHLNFFARTWDTLVEGFQLIQAQGWEAFIALHIGCILAGVVCGAINYPIAYYAIKKLRSARRQKRLRRAQRILEQTRKEIG